MCEAVVNSYFIIISLDRVCVIGCSALTLNFVLLLRLYACFGGLKWGRCFLYIAVWISTSGYQLLTILTQYCSIHCSSVTLPCGMWHLVPYYFSAISISNSVIPLSSIACGSIKCLVIGWLPPPYSFIVFHSFALSVHKLSKHIASTLLVPRIDSWHLRSLVLTSARWDSWYVSLIR